MPRLRVSQLDKKVLTEDEASQGIRVNNPARILDIQKNDNLDPGESPAIDSKYIITASGNLHDNFGTISGLGDNDIVTYNGASWDIEYDSDVLGQGAVVYNENNSLVYQYDGDSWRSIGVNGFCFAHDISDGTNISKTFYSTSSSSNRWLQSASTDSDYIDLSIRAGTGHSGWQPVIGLEKGGVQVKSDCDNWYAPSSSRDYQFEGKYDNVPLDVGDNIFSLLHPDGASSSINIYRNPGGPAVTNITNTQNYPGSQTAVKHNDSMTITVHHETDATSVVVKAQGACKTEVTQSTGGSSPTNISVTISSASGIQYFTAYAKNSAGTPGEDFTESNGASLDQTYPSISNVSTSYQSGSAVKNSEYATVSSTVSNADTAIFGFYNSSWSDEFNIPPGTIDNGLPSISARYYRTPSTADVTYNENGSVARITANRASNNATSYSYAVIRVAAIAPSIIITEANHLRSSPSGTSYIITLTSNQYLPSSPAVTMSAPVDATLSEFSTSNNLTWTKSVTIYDNMLPKGVKAYNLLSAANRAGLQDTSADASFNLQGFFSRTLTLSPAGTRGPLPIGTNVFSTDNLNATCSMVPGLGTITFTPSTTADDGSNTFTITDADGNYDADGGYFWLSDAQLAGLNSLGTATVIIEET